MDTIIYAITIFLGTAVVTFLLFLWVTMFTSMIYYALTNLFKWWK